MSVRPFEVEVFLKQTEPRGWHELLTSKKQRLLRVVDDIKTNT